MTEQQKVMARYGMIMEATKKAQGDLGRTMGSPTNKLRIMTEQAKYAAITLGTALLPTFTAVVNAIQPLLVKLQDLANKFAALTPQMQQNIIAAVGLTAAIGPLSTVIGGLTTIVGALLSPVGLAIAGFLAWSGNIYLMYKNTKSAMEQLLPIITNVVDTIVSKWKESRDQTISIFNSILAFLKEWWPLLLASCGPAGIVVAWIISHWEKIREGTITVWNAISSFFTEWWNTLVSWVSSWDIWSYAASTWESYKTNVIDVLRNLATEAIEWGQNVIQGLIDGMKSKGTALWDAAVSLAQQANNAVRKTLDSHSPSKVMIKEGRNICQGLIVGLLKDEKKVRDAAKSLAEKIQEVFTDYNENILSIYRKSTVFGGSFNAISAQFQETETALNRLIELGVDPASKSIKNLAAQWKKLHKEMVLDDVNKQLDIINLRSGLFGEEDNPGKINAIKDAMLELALSGQKASDEFQQLQMQLDSLEEKPHVINVVLNAMQQMGGSIGSVANQISNLGNNWGQMMTSFAEGGVGGILGGIAMIPGIISSVKGLWSSFSGKKKVAAFYEDIAQQSEANRQAALANMQPYKDYAKAIRDFSKNSLIEIRGLAEGSVRFLEDLDLIGTYEMVSKRIRRYFHHSTYWTQLWSYSFDEAGADAAKAFLDRFTGIANGLSSSVGSAFASGIKEFLSGKSSWVNTLRDGIKDAIIDAITSAVLQATIVKGYLGDLLGQLASGLTAGEDVSYVIDRIGSVIPEVVKRLENVLSPLRGALISAFANRVPAMASGGVVSRPTMALIGEAGPEAVVPLNKKGMFGGDQTIIIQLDGRTITQTVVKNMPAVVRVKTGVNL